MKKVIKSNYIEITSVVARESDGNVQITFTIPFSAVQKAQDDTVVEMAKDITVQGFRKGMAPLDKVKGKIPVNTLIEHSLSHILPQALSEAIKKHDLKIASYPKYELISAKEGESWQIKALTCELPEIKLPDYKQSLAKLKLGKSQTREERETAVIKYLVENTRFEIPKVLVDEEVNSRLNSLLARIEKLGLALESYLASLGKNPDTLRAEYEIQARDAIKLELILSRIIEEENVKVDEKELSSALEISQTANKPQEGENLEHKKRVLESILRKRKALEILANLT